MNILITGASGFVGGAVAKKLATNHSVYALARSENSASKIKEINSSIHIISSDLLSISKEDLRGIDIVIHSAAFVGPWGSKKDFWSGNVDGTKALVNACIQANVKRFIHISTEATIYSGVDLIDVDENYPYPNLTPYLYSETKREAEKVVLSVNQKKLETIVLRPRLIWGPGDTSVFPVIKKMILNNQFKWIDGGKKQTSTTYIENLTHAIELSLTKGRSGEVYFVSDGESISYFDFFTSLMQTENIKIPSSSIPSWLARFAAKLVEGLWVILGIKSQPPLMRFATDNMTTECTLNINKIKTEMGYKPVYSLKEGFQKMQR